MTPGQVDGPADADDGGPFVPNLAVRGDRPGRFAQPVADGLPVRADGRLVLAVGAQGQRGFREDRLQRLLRVHQQVARAGPDEDFDAGGRRQVGGFQFLQVVRRGPEVEAPVRHALRRGHPVLRLPEGAGRGRGDGVGHLQHGRHPAGHGGGGPGGEVLLVRQPGVAEMHLIVDHAGEDQLAGAVDRLVGGDRRGRVDPQCAAVQQHVDAGGAGREDGVAAAEQGSHRVGRGRWTRRAGTGRMPVRRRAVTPATPPKGRALKALVKAKPEPGLWLEDVPEPAVGPNDVLIRVRNTGICGTDLQHPPVGRVGGEGRSRSRWSWGTSSSGRWSRPART